MCDSAISCSLLTLCVIIVFHCLSRLPLIADVNFITAEQEIESKFLFMFMQLQLICVATFALDMYSFTPMPL